MLKRLVKPVWRLFRDILPSSWHIVFDHLRFHGTLPNLKHPRTFSEKISHRKLYDLDPRMPSLIDKISAKEQMASRFGSDFVIPTLAIFTTADEIDFQALPYPCVVKANHGSDMNLFLKRYPPDPEKERRTLNGFLRHNHRHSAEEWAYSHIHPRLLVEPLIEGGEHGLVDYKFHTFGGRVYAVQVDIDRYTDHRRCFFDQNWVKIPFELLYPSTEVVIPPPGDLQNMLQYAQQIGTAFSYIRVDLYEIAGKAKFGEVTFYPGAGLEAFRPKEFDELFGRQWV